MMIELAGETVPAVFIGNSYFYRIILGRAEDYLLNVEHIG